MKKFAAFAVLAVALAIPAVALAAKVKVSGGVVGDKNSRISATVVKKHGNMKVKGFRAANTNIKCGKQKGDFPLIRITGPGLSVNNKGSFKARIPNSEKPKEKVRISGVVSNGGRSISGNIKTNKLTIQGVSCDIPKQHFELKKK
jgi:hypothetical protein